MKLEPGRRLKGENNMSNHVLKEFVVGSGTSTQAVYRGLHFTSPGVSADHIHACGRNQEKKESYEEITRTYSTECVLTYTCVLFSLLSFLETHSLWGKLSLLLPRSGNQFSVQISEHTVSD